MSQGTDRLLVTEELLAQRLEMVLRWYEGMINERTGFFEYLYVPDSDAIVREQSPIRDVATIWDAALLGDFLKRDRLRDVIERSMARYRAYLVPHDDSLILDPLHLGEPSSIAHSAFMILALLAGSSPRSDKDIAALAEGIVRQQRPDGSYKVFFEDLPDSGEELYAGEAMLALLETHHRLGDKRLLDSATRAFAYYDENYFRGGRVTDDLLVFFANWQSQACRLLFEQAGTPAVTTAVAKYLFAMHDDIIARGFFDAVARDPDRQVSVEVACALEGLNDAYAIALALHDARTESYRRAICIGLGYLVALQCTQNCAPRETGGFGMSLRDRTQRIDVTGHAASAFLKAIANRVTDDSMR